MLPFFYKHQWAAWVAYMWQGQIWLPQHHVLNFGSLASVLQWNVMGEFLSWANLSDGATKDCLDTNDIVNPSWVEPRLPEFVHNLWSGPTSEEMAGLLATSEDAATQG